MSAAVSSITRSASPTARVPELDGLRGLAILLIVVLHYFVKWAQLEPGSMLSPILRSLSLSWTGVDLFFVLSGFLIGGILVENRGAANYFKVFYVRRVCRIFPLYFAWVLLFIVLLQTLSPAMLQAPLHWLFDKSLPEWSYLTFTQNVEMARCGEFGANWLAITWSLAVEEQFYLVLPLLVRFVPPRLLAPVLIGLIALAPVLRCTVLKGFASYVTMPCRADALLLGVLCAVALRHPATRPWLEAHRRHLYGMAGVLALGLGALTLRQDAPTSTVMRSVGLTWVALFYTVLLLIAVTEKHGPVAKLVRLAPLRQLGLMAFGVYLLHQAVNGLLHAWLRGELPVIRDAAGLGVTLVSLVITLALAWLSWTFFEKPFVNFGHAWKYSGNNPVSQAGATVITAAWSKQAGQPQASP